MKTNAPAISVIVPVYNVEQYLPRCINSILSQTFTDFELLLIDDGSTDKSGEICDAYSKEDRRIRVIHKENHGVSSARQVGNDNATGTYSIHADGDDWVEPQMLEKMYEKAFDMQADMLIADYYIDINGKEKYINQITDKTVPFDILKEILKGNLFGTLWHKLIRHSLYKEYNIRFISGINYCEDVLLLAQILKLDIKVSFLHEAYYHYDQQNISSITRNYTKESFIARQKYIRALEDILPVSCGDIIRSVAFKAKRGAFMHGVLRKEDFYNYMPTSLSEILFDKYGTRLKLCMLLSYLGLFDVAKALWIALYKK